MGEAFGVVEAFDGEGDLFEVGVVVVEQGVEQHALLHGGQGPDVCCGCGGEAVGGGLVDVDEGEVAGGGAAGVL